MPPKACVWWSSYTRCCMYIVLHFCELLRCLHTCGRSQEFLVLFAELGEGSRQVKRRLTMSLLVRVGRCHLLRFTKSLRQRTGGPGCFTSDGPGLVQCSTTNRKRGVITATRKSYAVELVTADASFFPSTHGCWKASVTQHAPQNPLGVSQCPGTPQYLS